ncbi:MAG: thymidylate synthase [Dehalococcoidales bacterium]|nr:thymidylate synthase [Dehalococcoidales bacterium]
MRIYTSPMEMIKEVERDLFEMGTRYQSQTVQDQAVKDDPKYMTIELAGYGYTLLDHNEDEFLKAMKYIGFSNERINWVLAETYERLIGKERNPGKAWERDKEFWGKFIRRGLFSYSYAERWKHQLPYVINELMLNRNTRQAIMTMYDQHQDMLNWGGLDRVPCSISYQFLIREEKLVLIYNQRSCDFIKFFPADAYITCVLLKFVADKIGVEPGPFIHFLGSLHAFAGDLEGRNIF